jgi:hypothetical protein
MRYREVAERTAADPKAGLGVSEPIARAIGVTAYELVT